MQIFNEKSAMETVARTIVEGVAPTGGSEITFSIRTRDGQLLDLRSLRYEVTPGIVGPGDPVRLTVRLGGNTALSTADISNLSAKSSTADGEAELVFRPQENPQAEAGTRTLIADFAAPNAAGAYIVRIRIPGLAEEHKDVFIVVEN
jgi:hypothetical protein